MMATRKNHTLAAMACVLFAVAAVSTHAAEGKGEVSSQRLRVIVMTDFPPIGVVKSGDVPNTMKSDPDDMQSMVRFLLYANKFDVEGLIATAGTFAMEAHKTNILGVLDQYEKVYGNLRKHDPNYPTADYLRSCIWSAPIAESTILKTPPSPVGVDNTDACPARTITWMAPGGRAYPVGARIFRRNLRSGPTGCCQNKMVRNV